MRIRPDHYSPDRKELFNNIQLQDMMRDRQRILQMISKRGFEAVLISGVVKAWGSSVHLFLGGHLRCCEMGWKFGGQVPG